MKKSLLILIVFVQSNLLFAQVIGGRSNSDVTPTVAKPSTISSGGFSGDVNLFSGQYGASIPLGGISTPGGLAFNLSLDYSSNYTIGATPPITTGIPYGDGWNLNLPTVSIETEVFNNFSYADYCDENQSTSAPSLNFNAQGIDVAKEGDLYWYSPYISIPGVASGRAVFKYVDVNDNKTAVFELNTFENHVEIRFNSEGWTVITADGTIYHFATAIQSYNAPANKRVLYYNNAQLQSATNLADDVINTGYGENQGEAVRNSISPKTRYNLWYCDLITHKNMPLQAISFYYEKFGAFNYFKEFSQNGYKQAAPLEFGNTTFNVDYDFTAYTDIFLKKIESSSATNLFQVLKLNYKTDEEIIVNNNYELVSVDPVPGVYRIDSLYTAKSILLEGSGTGANGFNNWKRYEHVKANQNTNNQSISPVNPYLSNNGYVRSDVPSNSSEIPFSHSFLESPRIGSAQNELIPGDIYEIRTKINRENSSLMHMGNGTIDIAVVSGTNDNTSTNSTHTYQQFNSNNGSYYPETSYNKTRGVNLFSTFNMALKWTLSYQEGIKETSNLFVMPNIPTAFDGINIQIGPGNSDVSLSEQPGALTNSLINGNVPYPNTKAAYYANLIQSTPPKSMADLPGNFGVGLPWSMMVPVYKQMVSVVDPLFGGGNPDDAFKFWWKDLNSNLTYPNEPTKLDNTVKLNRFELIRYAKNPYMLVSVEIFNVNGKVGDPTSSGLKLVSKKELEYSTKRVSLIENYDYNENAPLHFKENLKQVRILLSAIREIPVILESDTTKILTTFLGYKQVKYQGANANNYNSSLPINGYEGTVLDRFVDHLGGITKVEYYPIEDNRTVYKRTIEYSSVCGGITINPEYGLNKVYTVCPVVKTILKNDEQDLVKSNQPSSNIEHKKWTYDFDPNQKVARQTQLYNMMPQFHNGRKISDDLGFKKVTVYGPSLNINNVAAFVNTTVYEHHGIPANQIGTNITDENEYLLHGKIKSIREYDVNQVLYTEKLINYGYTLAFINGHERPNPYRENLVWDQQYDYPGNQYEYRDIYLNQVLTLNPYTTPLIGQAAYGFLDIPVFKGTGQLNELPKFLDFEYYDQIALTNPPFFLNSYFIKKTEEINRTYDVLKSKPINQVVIAEPSVLGMTPNPFGTGVINSVLYDQDVDPSLIEMIQKEEANFVKEQLIAASPLSDTVLYEMFISSTLKSNELTEILIAQNTISDDTWKLIFNDVKRFSQSDLLSLINMQPYFSDGVLLHFSSKIDLSWDEKIVESILLKNQYLTNDVLLVITNPFFENIHSGVLINVLSKQPQLSFQVIHQCTNNELIMSSSPERALINQVVSEEIYEKILTSPFISNEGIVQLIEGGKNYPSETLFNYILNHSPSFSENEMARIVSVANRELEPWIITELTLQFPRADFVRGNVFRGNPLDQYCNNIVEEEWTYIETKTSFEYYEADYRGKAIGRAYKVLMGLEDIPNRVVSITDVFGSGESKTITELYLKHEPSWQLFSSTSTSPHLPSAKQEEQYFYLYDLKNRYDRYWYNYDLKTIDNQLTTFDFKIFGLDTLMYTSKWDIGYASVQSTSAADFETPRYDGMTKSKQYNLRNLPFQKTTITKTQRNEPELQRSEYYYYDARWIIDPFSTAEAQQYGGPSCPGTGTPPPPPPSTGCASCDYYKFGNEEDLLELLPLNYCLWEAPLIGYYICPSSVDCDDCHEGSTLISCNQIVVEEQPQKYLLLNDALKKTLQLRKVIVQLDTVMDVLNDDFSKKRFDRSNNYVADFYMAFNGTDADNFVHPYRMLFPYDTLTTTWVRKINEHLQPALIENAMGIKTKFYYRGNKNLWVTNSNCNNPSYSYLYNYSAVEAFDMGLPVRVTVGYGRADSMATVYEYNDARQVKKVIAPSLKTMEYTFDGYQRLTSVIENGTRLLSTSSYNLWNHDGNLSFNNKIDQNYVQSELFNNAVEKELQKAFLDPLGRTAGMAKQYLDGVIEKRIYSGKVNYDNWGRAVQTQKTNAMNAFGSFSFTNNSYSPLFQSVEYENNPASQAIINADYGVALSAQNTIKTSTCFTNNVFASCELGLNNFELQQIMKSGQTNGFRFVRTEVSDQDGKKSVSYSNAFGQVVGTITWSNLNEKLVTLYVYDQWGNVKMTINPKKQSTEYYYNIVGQKVKERTLDGGEKRFMYNKLGALSAVQDQLDRDFKNASGVPTPRFRKFNYDDYGRPTGQMLMTTHYHLDPFLYESKSMGDANGNFIDQLGLPHYLRYTYTNRMSQDWLLKFVTLDPVNGGIITISSLPVNGFAGNIAGVQEKQSTYGLSQLNPSTLGKLIETRSYNLSGVCVQKITFTYNNLDQIASQIIRQHPSNESLNDSKLVKATITYPEYNYRGSLLEEKVDMGSDGSVDMKYFYTYDRLNRLSKVNAAQTDVLLANATLMATYNYDDARGMVSVTKFAVDNASNASVQIIDVANTYDDRDRLTRIKSGLMDYKLFYDQQVVPSLGLNTVSQSYNYNGNINGIQVEYTFAGTNNAAQTASLFSGATKYGYVYDLNNRLIQADAIVGDYVTAQAGSAASLRIGDESMTYDRIGNIATLLRVKPGVQMIDPYTTDDFIYQYTAGNNRLMLVDGQNGSLDRAYTYDANGNLLTDNFKQITATTYGRSSYTYNLTKGNETISYLYDGADQRFFKKVVTPAQTTEEMYVKDALGHDLAIVKFTTTGGATVTATEYFVFGADRIARVTNQAGGTAGRIYQHEATYFLQDHLGNTRVSFAYSGNASTPLTVVNAMDYYPYGKILREFDNGDGDRYLTTQHERDKETGLDYRGARYYDSDVARFLSTDPWADKYPAWSTYNYCMGNPVVFIDPTGKGVEYTKETAQQMAKRGKDNGYSTSVVENPDKPGDYGVNFSMTVNGKKYEGVQYEGKFKGIIGGKLKKYDGNKKQTNSENTTLIKGDPIKYNRIGNRTNGYTYIQEADAVGVQFESGFAFVGGMSMYTGYLTDYKGNTLYYKGYSGNIGFGLGAGGNAFIVKSQTNTRFTVDQWLGNGEGWSGGVGVFSASIGGTDGSDKYRVYSGGLSVGKAGVWWSGTRTTSW